jgi:hypothetical protein
MIAPLVRHDVSSNAFSAAANLNIRETFVAAPVSPRCREHSSLELGTVASLSVVSENLRTHVLTSDELFVQNIGVARNCDFEK